MSEILRVENLTKQYHKIPVLKEMTFSVEEGSIFAIIGPQYSSIGFSDSTRGLGGNLDFPARTELLYLLSGLKKPSGGAVIQGENLLKAPVSMGLYIDGTGIYRGMTVENHFYMKAAALNKDRAYADQIMTLCGILYVRKYRATNLTRDLKNRMGIGLALMGEPRLLILDAPFSGLKEEETTAFQTLLKAQAAAHGMTIIVTSDDASLVSGFATHYLSLSNGELTAKSSREEIHNAMPGYIELIAEPLDEAKRVLDSMGIFSYQTKSQYKLHIFERFQDAKLIEDTLTEAGVHVTSCRLIEEDEASFFTADSFQGSHSDQGKEKP